MRVNISVSFAVVEEIDAGQNSVDLADLEASGMGPKEAAAAVSDRRRVTSGALRTA